MPVDSNLQPRQRTALPGKVEARQTARAMDHWTKGRGSVDSVKNLTRAHSDDQQLLLCGECWQATVDHYLRP